MVYRQLDLVNIVVESPNILTHTKFLQNTDIEYQSIIKIITLMSLMIGFPLITLYYNDKIVDIVI